MPQLVKIGHTFLNLDLVWCADDRFATDKVDEVVIRFGPGEDAARVFTGAAADDLRTWLNSQSVNLRAATQTDLPIEGRSM